MKRSKEPKAAKEKRKTELLRRMVAFLRTVPSKKGGRAVLYLAFALCCIGLAAGIVFLSVSAAVCAKTAPHIVARDAVDSLDGTYDCVLILGCRVYADGRMSHMLEDRVRVGVALYKAGVCDTLLMSGDSQTDTYDEVGAMKNAALEWGVAEEDIAVDPLGLSTYESLARYAEGHKGARILIVTQEYHLHRALYIAEKLGLDATGVDADLRPYAGQLKRDVREILARCKDVYLTLAKN